MHPATLTAPSGSIAPTDSRVLRARVYASPSYEAQTPDWKGHFAEVLAEASATLDASVGASVAVVETGEWEVRQDAKLDEQLRALRARALGADVDLVVGLVGGLPVTSASFDQLGMSETPGKHLVLRAPDVAKELTAVDREYAHLSTEARERLRRERIRHAEVAVALHELGHALGAEHEKETWSLMAPTYDRRMSAFGPAAIARMRATLAPQAKEEPRAVEPAPAATMTSADVPAAPDGIRAEHREAWALASSRAEGGDAEGAWSVAQPLFAAYPEVYEVQDLRCKLALARGGSYDAVHAECEKLMKLSLKGARPK